MKIIIVSLQVSQNGSKGHLNPAIELALAGKKRGHDISLLPLPCPLSEEETEQLLRLSIPFINPPHVPESVLKTREELAFLAADSSKTHLAYKSFILAPLPYQIQPLRKLLKKEKPDAVISDVLVYGLTLVANDLGIPNYGFCAGLKLLAEDSSLNRYANISRKLEPHFQDIFKKFDFPTRRRHLELLAKKKNFVFFPQKYQNLFRDDPDILLAGSLSYSQRQEFSRTTAPPPKKAFCGFKLW